MIGRSVELRVVEPLSRLGRFRECLECGRRVAYGEMEFWVATVYDRGRVIIRACRACHGRRARLEWLEERSIRRLQLRISNRGFGSGAELVETRRRLGLEPSRKGRGRGTR